MESVVVSRSDLITKIKTNRDEHRAIFEEAIEGYRKRAIEILDEQIAKLKSGKKERVQVSLPYPTDHTGDYDRVLLMLEMHTEDTIEIPEHYFKQYVMDDWAWQQEFLTTSSSYSALARKKFAT